MDTVRFCECLGTMLPCHWDGPGGSATYDECGLVIEESSP